MINYPVRVEQSPTARLALIRDASDRAIAGGMSLEDAEHIAQVLNAAKTEITPILKHGRRKSRKELLADKLRESDVTAQAVGRDDVIYGHHDSLPQCGENVARLGQLKQE